VSVRNDNLEIVFAGWVDALRRNDLEAIERHVHPDAVWQGLRPDLVCGDRAAILANVGQNQGWLPDVEAVALSAQGDQVLFSVRSPDLVEVAGEELDEAVHQVFTLTDGLIVRIDEYRARVVHVADVERSVAFCALLGFAVDDTHRHGEELDPPPRCG
jgi:ketosteroid isomerase-like protein